MFLNRNGHCAEGITRWFLQQPLLHGTDVYLQKNHQRVHHQSPLLLNFIDFRKMFNSVRRQSLWNIMLSYEVSQSYICRTLSTLLVSEQKPKDSSCCSMCSEGGPYLKCMRWETNNAAVEWNPGTSGISTVTA